MARTMRFHHLNSAGILARPSLSPPRLPTHHHSHHHHAILKRPIPIDCEPWHSKRSYQHSHSVAIRTWQSTTSHSSRPLPALAPGPTVPAASCGREVYPAYRQYNRSLAHYVQRRSLHNNSSHTRGETSSDKRTESKATGEETSPPVPAGSQEHGAPWLREGAKVAPADKVEKDVGAEGKGVGKEGEKQEKTHAVTGKLMTTPSHMLKMIVPLKVRARMDQ